MMRGMRHEILSRLRRVVVKIGSHVLTGDQEGLDHDRIREIARQLTLVRQRGVQVVIVSSGAMAAGRPALGLAEKPRSIPQKQAVASVGQPKLMQAYEEAFGSHSVLVGQILLTGDDLGVRKRFQNARAAIDALLDYGAVPIINENDAVAVDEIKFGDNDHLSSLVTNLVEADLLLILTDIDGLYDADPRTTPDARMIHTVRSITREVERVAGGSGSSVGTGGMATKVKAARRAALFGVPTVIINGSRPETIARLFAGEEIGTLFLPAPHALNRRKHWIAHSLRPSGRIVVDDGAGRALARGGKSLLPSGVIGCEGEFDRGSAVRVVLPDGREIARGLSDYSSGEIARIRGRHSREIEDILGYRYGDEVIHRDNLVVTGGELEWTSPAKSA